MPIQGLALPAIIAAGAQIGGQIIGGIQNRGAMRRQRRYDRQMMREMNEYNSPRSQMQRLEEAGLNPNLIYGSGTASTGQQTTPVRGEFSDVPLADPAATMSAYYDIQSKGTEIKYRQRQIETEMFNAWMKQTQIANLERTGQLQELEFEFLNSTLDDRRRISSAEAIKQEALSIIARKHVEWTQKGMNPNDATWLRMTVEMLQTLGVNFKNVADKYLQGPQYHHKQYPK